MGLTVAEPSLAQSVVKRDKMRLQGLTLSYTPISFSSS